MGHGKLNAAVLDSGPLIHLAEIGCLRFLGIFEALYVPHAVWLETVGQNRVSQGDLFKEIIAEEVTVARPELDRFIKENNLADLHAGEKECLWVCKEKGILTLLTDDMAVRDAARLLKLVPVGSLGIIVAAYRRELVSLNDAEQYISDLYNVSSLFITRDLADLAIEQLRAHIQQGRN